MPIFINELTIWEICFRQCLLDPRKIYFNLPLEVDNFSRTLLIAIHNAELPCESITLEKRHFEKHEIKESFYYWADDFFNAYNTSKPLSRKLLKWAVINRYDFKLWCERMNAPLPEFWFPKGWNLEYQIPENEFHPGHQYLMKDWSKEERDSYLAEIQNQLINTEAEANNKSRPSQVARLASQVVASNLWKQHPEMTIADMIKRSEIQELCGAGFFTSEVVRRWLSEVAPREVSKKRGRPKTKNTTE